jgi:hypothetical protein
MQKSNQSFNYSGEYKIKYAEPNDKLNLSVSLHGFFVISPTYAAQMTKVLLADIN